MIRQARLFVEQHGANRFQSLDWNLEAGFRQPERVANRAGFRRKTPEGAVEYILLTETFKQEFCRGYEWRNMAKVLADAGYLVKENGRMQARRVVPDISEDGQTRFYVISGSILGIAEDQIHLPAGQSSTPASQEVPF